MKLALMMATVGLFGATCCEAEVSTTNRIFYFQGVCALNDCTGVGGGELTLTPDYNYGDQISNANFVSWQYYGTDKLPEYTIDAQHFFSLGGSMNTPLPGQQTFNIIGNDGENAFFFSSSITSDDMNNWSTGYFNSVPSDHGSFGTFSTQPFVMSSVPEVGSWLMMIAGFGVAGGMLRRRHRVLGVKFGPGAAAVAAGDPA